MTRGDLELFREWFSSYCKSFYHLGDEDRANILLKEEHTHKVCENILAIAAEESFEGNDLLLAEAVGLFHDVGRFEQFSKYRTFKDSISVNHGLLGSEILAREKVLKNLPESEQTLILQTVKFHNAFTIPDLSDDNTTDFLKLIRDADKIDIFRIFFEYYGKNKQDRPSAAGLGFPDTPEYSGEILSHIFDKRLISLSMLRTLNDFKLTKLSWIYDLNFNSSLRMVLENDYINRISATLPRTEEIGKAIVFLHGFVEERLGNGKKG